MKLVLGSGRKRWKIAPPSLKSDTCATQTQEWLLERIIFFPPQKHRNCDTGGDTQPALTPLVPWPWWCSSEVSDSFWQTARFISLCSEFSGRVSADSLCIAVKVSSLFWFHLPLIIFKLSLKWLDLSGKKEALRDGVRCFSEYCMHGLHRSDLWGRLMLSSRNGILA